VRSHPPTADCPAPIEQDPEGLRVDPVLFDQNSRRQGVDRVVVQNGNSRLNNDRSGVEGTIDQMHRGSRDPGTVLERLPLRVQSGKRRKQRRMDVHDPVREGLQKHGPDEPHVPGKAHQASVASTELIDDCAFIRITVGVVSRSQMDGGDAGLAGPYQTWGSGPIRDDNRHGGVKMPEGDRVEYRLEVAAPAGDEDGKPPIHGASV